MEALRITNPIDYRVALYIRLSKEDEKPGESESISNQRSLLQRFAEKERLYIVDEYIDDGISGTTFERPGFKRMIHDIEIGRVNMVISKDLSRLGRDYIQTGYYIEKYFPENRVRYISILDNVDTGIDSSSNDITPFKSILNDMYAKDISYKIKSVKHNKQDLGLFIGGKPPFGYKSSPETTNKLIIDEEARKVVERIFNEAKSGKACFAIAMDLTLDGIPTPSQYATQNGAKVKQISKKWSDARIREILLNEVYIGNMVQGRTKKVSYKSKKTFKIPRDEWKVVTGTHEPIISKEDFEKVREMIESRKRTRVRKYDYLLKGLVYCHECGKKIGCSTRELANGRAYYFRCATYYKSQNGNRECSPHNIKTDIVEQIVIEKIKSICNQYADKAKFRDITLNQLQKNDSKTQYEQELSQCYAKLDKLNNEIDSIYNDKLNGILTEEDFFRIYNGKKEEKEKLQRKITTINTHLSADDCIGETEMIDKIVENFLHAKQVERSLIVDLISRIEIDKDKNIYVYFKFQTLQ
ncbi:MAG: resolvase [Clostridiales bacterium]|nr:resolvase [Clostridiales bacterium]